MDVLKAIKKRRSVRQFQDKPISQEYIDKLSEALIWAPSAGNLQSRKFYFVFDKVTKEKLSLAANRQQPVTQAPLVVVCCVNEQSAEKYGERGKKLFAVCDVAASVENLMLEACELGLATLWMGAFDEEKIRDIIRMPRTLRPVALVPVGYADETPEPPVRLSKDQIVTILNGQD